MLAAGAALGAYATAIEPRAFRIRHEELRILPDGARPIADLPACRAAVHQMTGHVPVSDEEAAAR